MSSFRRLALLLALGLPATPVLFAQSSSSSSNPTTPDQGQAQQPAGEQTPQQMSVQARIRARREQRRATAIHDSYAHLYDAYATMGYLRFKPGPDLQKLTFYAWDTGVTRYLNDRLGVTVDGRGYYGTAYVGLNFSAITRPAVSTYTAMVGPTYRFYMQPRYAISGRVLGGYAHGNFTGDTNGFGTIVAPNATKGLLYPDGGTYAASVSVLGELNLTPNVALRLAPEYFVTGFGSSTQNSLGFTGGLVYRFGKQ
jgi:hypothetical protein